MSEDFVEKAEDMALRLTNFAMERKLENCQVVVHWLVNSPDVAEKLDRAMQAARWAGVATFTVVEMAVDQDGMLSSVSADDDARQDSRLSQELFERWREEAADEIKSIVEREHPAAIERWPDSRLDTLSCAYSGIESARDYFDDSDLSFWIDQYAQTLPFEQRSKAITWLALLQREVAPADLDDLFEANSFMLDSIVLAYLLHSFQSALDEDELDFDYLELAEIVPISDVFVGAFLKEDDLINICSNNYDPGDLLGDALRLVAEQRVQGMVDGLTSYFGSGSSLFYTLWACKSQRYSVDVAERIDDALNKDCWSSKLDAFDLVQPRVGTT